ncbi:MAG: MFS transporter [Burkholderiaceae bacterium]
MLALVYGAFISLGLPDSVLGVAWPRMRLDLDRPLAAAGLVTFILTACSAASGFASEFVLARLGTGRVVAISGFLTALALLGFGFAPTFGWILLLAVPLGLGAGAVDAGLNHFVARHYAARHMNWLHGCWGIGATLGPMVMGVALAHGLGWQGGYRGIGVIQLMLALVFLINLRLWQHEPERPVHAQATQVDAPMHRRTPAWAPWGAASLYLVYTSVELGTGLWAASILVEGRGKSVAGAGVWVACFYGAIMAGRFAVGVVAERMGNRRLVRAGLAIAVLGAVLFAMGPLPEALSLLGLVLLGLGCAPIYPSLMHETSRRFDADTARRVIGRQVAFSYLGCALGPAALGLLAGRWGLWTIMPTVVLGLLLMLWMSWRLDRVT